MTVTPEQLEKLGFVLTSKQVDAFYFRRYALYGDFPIEPRATALFYTKQERLELTLTNKDVAVSLDNPTYEKVLSALEFANFPIERTT